MEAEESRAGQGKMESREPKVRPCPVNFSVFESQSLWTCWCYILWSLCLRLFWTNGGPWASWIHEEPELGLLAGVAQPIKCNSILSSRHEGSVGRIQSAVPGRSGESSHSRPGYVNTYIFTCMYIYTHIKSIPCVTCSQVRRVLACGSSPPCRSPPATWEPAPMLVATTNPIGCPQRRPSPACLWAEPPSRSTSAAV